MVFKKGHRPHNKGEVLRDANYAKKPTKHHSMEIGFSLPEQGTQYDDPKFRGKNSVWKDTIESGF